MNNIHKRRLWAVSLMVLTLGLAVAFVLYALKQNINVFLTPSELLNTPPSSSYSIRLGGMVKKGSLIRSTDSLLIQFTVTDLKRELPVRYTGVLPDLFREGKGVIAEGTLNAQGTFVATQILAKHDENYMPKKIYKALREKSA